MTDKEVQKFDHFSIEYEYVMKERRAFTLIELLVVIAIIAILAAILFPVFAQAKQAAKRTTALSNTKQLNTACLSYLNDYDDTYPMGMENIPGIGWNNDMRFPAGWRNISDPDNKVGAMSSGWANAMMPYVKSYDVFHAPNEQYENFPGVDYTAQLQAPNWSNITYNGDLTGYAASGVAAPSSLITFWQGNGVETVVGYAWTQPYLYCPDPTQPCRYTPMWSGCGIANGDTSYMSVMNNSHGGYTPGLTQWMYGNGSNFSMADGSAKFRHLGMNQSPNYTDYRTDPFLGYNNLGQADSAWADDLDCHYYLFRPDFDYQGEGTPTIWGPGVW